MDFLAIIFVGIDFPGIADVEGYLSFKFGDYMEFPPEEQCVVDGCSYFSFDSEEKPTGMP